MTGAMRAKSLLNRSLLVAGHSVNQLLPAITGILTSLLVIRFGSISLWGEFVYVTVVFSIVNSVIGWGNKEFLLRSFSRAPRSIDKFWQRSVIARLPLLLLIVPVLFIFTGIGWHGIAFAALWGVAVFVHQSFESLVMFHKRFTFAATLEAIAAVILLAEIVWLRDRLTLDVLLLIFTIPAWLKAIAIVIYFRKQAFANWIGKFDAAFFRDAQLFFLLTLVGLLEIKIDLLCINYFLPKSEVGRYQVLIMFLIYLKNAGFFLTAPFIKNIYRMNRASLHKLRNRLFAFGAPLLLIGIAAIFVALSQIYGFNFSWDIYLLGYLFAVPHLLYLIETYQLIREKRERIVLMVSIAGIGCNLLLNMLLIPQFGLTGAIFSSAISQWMILILYRRSEDSFNRRGHGGYRENRAFLN